LVEVFGEFRTVHTRELQLADANDAAALLSRGMRDNPNNMAAFGGASERRQTAMAGFFRAVVKGLFRRGIIIGAFDESRLVGVCGMARPGKCQPGLGEKLRILGALLRSTSPGVSIRVARWGGTWASRDLKGPHWHLGPVAVDIGLQGRGVGSALLTSFCERMDEVAATAYLETDKRENLRFYEKHGFTIVGEGNVLGVPNWYMSRAPRQGTT
jgi:ribosomal protein S18 acetylase RimI-like enzyme